MKNRTFVMGDVHGAHKALVQVLERAGFDRTSDTLIFLGDVADGWPETRACIDELLTIKHLVALLGNHDEWFQKWVEDHVAEPAWVQQGGAATILSYGSPNLVPRAHREYLKRAKLWHQDGDRIFVHGGWPPQNHAHPLAYSTPTWNRSLWKDALAKGTGQLSGFREVYIGHTTTTRAGFTEPVQKCEVWNLDQGAGWEGKLSIMDVDSKEFWQSDLVAELYPEHAGRRRAA